MNRLLTLLILAVGMLHASAAPETYSGSKDKLHIYLLIGQSNMSGRAPIPAGDDGHIDRCYLLNTDGQWNPSAHPFNGFSTIRKGLGMQKLNPGHSFAQTMLAKQPGISIGLVVNAKGGSRINEWKTGGKFYTEAVRRAKQAQQSGTIMGILWHQGESDSGAPDGYLEKLVQLATDLRKDLEAPDLPFIAGQVNKVPAINDQIAKLPTELKHSGYVSSDGLKAMDRWHFDTKSMTTLGERYAEEMLKLLPKRR